jgi:hypothetical protein
VDAPGAARVIGQKLWNLARRAAFFHVDPEANSFPWIKAGERHQEQPYVIGLGFLLAIVGFSAQEADPSGRIAGHAFVGVVSQRVGYFVAEHDGDLVVVLRNSQDACENDYLSARKAEGVNLVVARDVRFPIKAVAPQPQIDFSLERFDAGSANKLTHYIMDAPDLRIVHR